MFNNFYAVHSVEIDENTGRVFLSAGEDGDNELSIYNDVNVSFPYGFISVPAVATNEKNPVPTIIKTHASEVCIAIHDERSQVIAKDLKDGESVMYSMKEGAIKVSLKCLQETLSINVNGLTIVIDKDNIVVGGGSDKVVRKSDFDAMRAELNQIITLLISHTHPETGTTTSPSAMFASQQPLSSQPCSDKLKV